MINTISHQSLASKHFKSAKITHVDPGVKFKQHSQGCEANNVPEVKVNRLAANDSARCDPFHPENPIRCPGFFGQSTV